jgi:hypothetical protein
MVASAAGKDVTRVIPPEFLTFFAASLTADGALIGLLFVAISIQPERTFGEDAILERELGANGAFNGLVNAFLISMLALIPKIEIGWGVIVLAVVALLNTSVYTMASLRRTQKNYRRSLAFTIGAVLVYGLEIYYSIHLIQQPRNNLASLYGLIFVLVGNFGFALTRSWTLLGGERRSFTGMLIDASRTIARRRRQTEQSPTHAQDLAPTAAPDGDTKASAQP